MRLNNNLIPELTCLLYLNFRDTPFLHYPAEYMVPQTKTEQANKRKCHAICPEITTFSKRILCSTLTT